MQNQYFVYRPEFFNRDSIAGQVTVLDPQVSSESSKRNMRNVHRYFTTLIISVISALFGLFSIFVASGAGVFSAVLALIVCAILMAIWNLDKNSAVTITLNESKLSRRVAQAAALAKVGALDENESWLIAKLIWDTHGLRKRLEGNQALENAINSIVEKAEMKLEDRENDAVQKSLRESANSTLMNGVNEPSDTWYEHGVKQPHHPTYSPNSTVTTYSGSEQDSLERQRDSSYSHRSAMQ